MGSEDVVREWLALAREDVEVARRVWDIRSVAAFHLQQAAEKALKAFLVRQGVRPPRTHDIIQLRELAGPSLDWMAPPEEMSRLTSWNAAFRYPDGGRVGEVDEQMLAQAALLVDRLIISVTRPTG